MVERMLLSEKELALAYIDLQLTNDIEFSENCYKFTPSGIENACKLWWKLPPKYRLNLFLFVKVLIEYDAGFDKKKGIF
jgi:hypothetical protein